MSREVKQINVRVFGKVQGVYFRQSVLQQALDLGIEGLVMNEPDGSVFIVAKGPEKILNELVSFCRKGPERALVKHVHIEEEDVGDLKGFRIL